MVKRQAQPPANASGARPPPQRYVAVHLSPFAPGLEKAGVSDPRRWREFWGRHPEAVVRSVLKRLCRDPGEVQVRTAANGDVELVGACPDDLLSYQSCDPDEPVILAVFWDGITEATINGILRSLHGRRWRAPARYQAAQVIPLHPGQYMADPEEEPALAEA